VQLRGQLPTDLKLLAPIFGRDHTMFFDISTLRETQFTGIPNVAANLAREIMELFSLGVGNYTEQDIKEGARALTGYVADRFNVPQAGLTPRDCEERLKPVNEVAAAEVRALLDRCDAARFAGLSAGEASDLRSRALAALQSLEGAKGGTR